jgi:hypothetical protein
MNKTESNADTKYSTSQKKIPFTFFLLICTWAVLAAAIWYFHTLSNGSPVALLKNLAQSGNISIDIAALNERVATLEAQIEKLEVNSSLSPSSQDHFSSFIPQETALEETAEAQDFKNQPMTGENTTLSPLVTNNTNVQQDTSRLDFLEKQLIFLQQKADKAEEEKRHTALVLVATELLDTIKQYKPYNHILASFRELAGKHAQFNSALDIVSEKEKEGIVPFTTLENNLNTAAQKSFFILRESNPDPSLIESLSSYFPSVIRIQKTEISGDDNNSENRILRAEKFFKEKNLSAAITQIEALDEPSIASLFDEWLIQAKQHNNILYHAERLVVQSRSLAEKTGDAQ